jgi:hypothetical protein
MPSPFPQMESFITTSESLYNLSLFRMPCSEDKANRVGMKEALETYHQERPEVKAILIGIRKGDPFSGCPFYGVMKI